MIRFDLTTLRIFMAVYNLESLTRAAEKEHIASSAVSKRINDLEADLGVALFNRHPRGVSSTPAGHAMARHVRQIFEQVNEMAAELSVFAIGVQGQVRIHANPSAMTQFLPPTIASFSARYGDVQIILREESSPNVIQSMQDGIADIGIVASNLPLPAGLGSQIWRQDRLIALLPVSDPLASAGAIPFKALSDRPQISLESGSSLQVLLEDAAERMSMQINNRLEVTTLGAAVAMASAGLGVAVVPQWIVDPANRRVAAVQLTDHWAERHLAVVTRERARLHATVGLMLDHLLSPEPYPDTTPPVPKR